MIIQVDKISKAFNENTILKDVSFTVNEGEKVYIIGQNGSGKTTLFNIINNDIDADEGRVIINKNVKFVTLKQFNNINTENSIYDEVLSQKKYIIKIFDKLKEVEALLALRGNDKELINEHDRLHQKILSLNGYAYESEVMGIIKGLGLYGDVHNTKVGSLSGGERTRLILAKIFASDADLIMLDEPTNHLDLNSMQWLENYIKTSCKTFIIISHDRYLMDKTAGKIVEIKNSKARMFSGNYSDYLKKSEDIYKAQLKAYENRQEYIKKQETIIKRFKQFNREKSLKQARSREKLLERLEVIENPYEEEKVLEALITSNRKSGTEVLNAKGLSKKFEDKVLFENIDFTLLRGEKVSIIGENGCGKTTLLKILLNKLNPDAGQFKFGTNVDIGYLDQEQFEFTYNNSLFDEIRSIFPEKTDLQIRSTLASFGFYKDEVFKLIEDLSGGERVRFKLAILFMKRPNLLILDEPTNHLDISMHSSIENLINAYEGSVIIVSHDRYFINEVTDRILSFENKKLINYLGNYDYYLEKKSEDENQKIAKETKTKGDSRIEYKKIKSRIRKYENRIGVINKTVTKLEQEIDELKTKIDNPINASDFIKLNELYKKVEQKEEEILTMLEEEEELKSSLEDITEGTSI